MSLRALRPFFLAILLTVPGLALRVTHPDISPLWSAFLAGVAILGASFLLTWACEVAQLDIPQAIAVAVVAFIAVLPEYAVDMYFTWMAGQHPESAYSHYAIANMTGANRLLIGVGWSAIVLIFAMRYHKGVALPDDKRTDVLFLGMATVYALFIPLKGSLTWVDGVILLAWPPRISARAVARAHRFRSAGIHRGAHVRLSGQRRAGPGQPAFLQAQSVDAPRRHDPRGLRRFVRRIFCAHKS